MGLPVVNFGKVTVSTGYAAGATSIVLTGGHGSKLPSTTSIYYLVWWNSTDYSDPSDDPNVEIVKVTARSGDTLTVTRGQDGTSDSTKNTGGKTYKMILALVKAHYESLQAAKQTFRGLTLRTHPDMTLANYQNEFSDDSIVMQDGEQVDTWTRIITDITVAGAGGLDTGSEAASTWYKQLAIRKRSDGTKNGLLHRAKNYLEDETSTAGEDGQHLLRDAAARTKLGQGFKVDNASKLEFVDVKIVKVGTPSGGGPAYWFTIQGDSTGLPNESDIKATSDKYDATRVPTSAVFVRVPFRTPFSPSAATQYHLCFNGDFTINGSNHLGWRADTTAGAYANGSKAAYDGATWTADADDDFIFKIYITMNETADDTSLPSGYDQYCHIGWVYNNSTSHFKAFMQSNRTVRTSVKTEWFVGAISTAVLTDLAAFIPPALVTVTFVQGNDAANYMMVGHISTVDISTTGADLMFVSNGQAVAGSDTVPGSAPLPPILLEYQAAMLANGGAGGLWVAAFTW